MTPKLQRLFDSLTKLGLAPTERLGELTVEVKAPQYLETCATLRDGGASPLGAAQLAAARARVLPRRRVPGALLARRGMARGELVRARGVRPLRHHVRRASGPAPHPHRLRLHRPSVPQGLPAVGPCRDALRPRAAPRHLPARHHRSARSHAEDRARTPLRGRNKKWLRSATTPSTSARSIRRRTACCAWCSSSTGR